ncbi:MAG: ATP12 family protein [Pseudomonadota bacterium]
MTGWAARRFWDAASVSELEGGFGVRLDSRPVHTPAKTVLIVPTRALAHEIALEWDAQDGEVQPYSMPMTRAANAAIDKVRPQRAEVAQLLLDYGGSDLVCYRADGPQSLVERQRACWDPVLDWTAKRFGVRLKTVAGVMHVAQDPLAMRRFATEIDALDDFALTAFHDLVTLSGSLAIGFAALEGWQTPNELWQISRADEIWQQELWGEDEEAARAAALKGAEFSRAKTFHDLSRPPVSAPQTPPDSA